MPITPKVFEESQTLPVGSKVSLSLCLSASEVRAKWPIHARTLGHLCSTDAKCFASPQLVWTGWRTYVGAEMGWKDKLRPSLKWSAVDPLGSLCWGITHVRSSSRKIKKLNPPYANLSAILFQLWPPSWKKFRCSETSRRSQCLLVALCFYQYVEVDKFLHPRRCLTVSQFSSWALCVEYQYLKPVWRKASSEADSGPFSATDVDDASNARSAAQRTIERWRERWR